MAETTNKQQESQEQRGLLSAQKSKEVVAQAKAVLFGPSLLRMDRPEFIFHPSRVPGAAEFRTLFKNAEGHTVEFDVRATMTEEAVIQGRATDRYRAWDHVASIGDLEKVFGQKRLLEVLDRINSRMGRVDADITNTYRSYDISKVKDNMMLKDMTLEELKRFAALGGEEVLGLREFLDLYETGKKALARPPKLVIDFQDGETTTATLQEIIARKLLPNVYLVQERSLDALKVANGMLSNYKDVQLSASFPSGDMLRTGKMTPAAYADYGREAVRQGANWLGTELMALPFIHDLLSNSAIKFEVFVNPNDRDMGRVLEAVRKYPTITALQFGV